MEKTKSSHFQSQIKNLELLLLKLKKIIPLEEKVKILDAQDSVKEFLRNFQFLQKLFEKLDPPSQYICKSVLAIGQGHLVFQGMEELGHPLMHLKSFIDQLLPVDHFYQSIGGLIGYHLVFLKLLKEKENKITNQLKTNYLKPPGIDLSQDSLEVRQAIRVALERLSEVAEMYPVGGAGDRLNLIEENTGKSWPAAQLPFQGKTLLEGLMRDLQAKEYLCYKLIGKQINVPVAMMTSSEKDNHHHILTICQKQNWFGRPPESFRLFMQPMVPSITCEGNWVVTEPLKLIFKPGGHGAIWQLARDQKILDFFHSYGCQKILLRQINNPIAGIDFGLLAFVGIGLKKNKGFGFSSCPRLKGMAEGMNVLIEEKTEQGYLYHITNIEYTNFIKEMEESDSGSFSTFPANTNILFADVNTIKKALGHHPLPGILINMKHKMRCRNIKGGLEEIEAGRLELLMQNLADGILDYFPKKLEEREYDQIETFLTYHERQKTIAATKKSYTLGHPIMETPEGCYYQFLQNGYDLLKNYCKMDVPPLEGEENFLKEGPPFIFSFHPSLGPLWSIIAQKMRGGTMAKGSQLHLEIAELELKNLHLKGSLIIHAEDVLGHKDANGRVIYSRKGGKCTLINVLVSNKGIDFSLKNVFWKEQITHKEVLSIFLEGDAEFIAEDVTFQRGSQIRVPQGHRMRVHMENQALQFHLEKLEQPSWSWEYTFDEEERIVLSKRSIDLLHN